MSRTEKLMGRKLTAQDHAKNAAKVSSLRKEHSVTPSFEKAASEDRRNPVRIHSGKDKPSNTFAAVQYLDYWYWIDNSDWRTKRAFTAVMFFFTLAETGGNEKLPLITIPAQ